MDKQKKMTDNIDYGGWLTEDLESLMVQLKSQKDNVETYTERVDLNLEMQRVKKELKLRKDNE